MHGCIELFAVGGLAILTGEPIDAFLGSSLKPLKNKLVVDGDRTTEKIYVTSSPKAVVNSERLLCQYHKKHSNNMWSFHLKSIYDIGFSPIHPILAEKHSFGNSLVIRLQSFIMNSFAKRTVNHLVLEELLLELKSSKKFMRKLHLNEFSGTTLADLYGNKS